MYAKKTPHSVSQSSLILRSVSQRGVWLYAALALVNFGFPEMYLYDSAQCLSARSHLFRENESFSYTNLARSLGI